VGTGSACGLTQVVQGVGDMGLPGRRPPRNRSPRWAAFTRLSRPGLVTAAQLAAHTECAPHVLVALSGATILLTEVK
jgi:hypothetical protein